MTAEQISLIENRLHYTFCDKQLLITAFSHSSYAKQCGVKDNERLEFLGDAVLDMVVSKYLCCKFYDCAVGSSSTMRASIVSAEGLRPVVDELDVLCFLQVANGASSIKSVSKKIESNLYEAIVAAIYLDGGLHSAEQFILSTLAASLDSLSNTEQKDSKTLLQEYCQKYKKSVPKYVISERSGTDNNPTYKYDLYVDDVYMCSGVGSSKKIAEQDAARKLVTKWRID